MSHRRATALLAGAALWMGVVWADRLEVGTQTAPPDPVAETAASAGVTQNLWTRAIGTCRSPFALRDGEVHAMPSRLVTAAATHGREGGC